MAVAAVLATARVPIPYFAISPGPARDVERMLLVAGAKPDTHEHGHLYLTTVSLQSVNVATAMLGWLDRSVDVVPRKQIIPPETTEHQVDKLNVAQMEDSKKSAATAALKFLGLPVRVTGTGARVFRVFEDGPSAGTLQRDDVIQSVNGQPVQIRDELIAAIGKYKAGSILRLVVTRSGRQLPLTVRSMLSSDSPPRPILGIQVLTENEKFEFPFTIDIRSNGIVGPSAGLMYALGIVDMLQQGDITNGHEVAGTGVITKEGDVSPVGGVAQKVAAAERAHATIFLVPEEEVQDARRAAHKLRVIGVRNLRDAVKALSELSQPVSAAGRGSPARAG